MIVDFDVPEYDSDVCGDVQCPTCESYDITVVAQATFKGMIGVHRTTHSKFDYVISNTVDSFKSDDSTQEFYCDDCENTWPVDGKIYWEWYE